MPGSLITLTGVRGALFPFQGAVTVMLLSLKVLGCSDASRPINRAPFVAQHATLSRNWAVGHPEADSLPAKDVTGRLLHAGDAEELYSGNAAFITGFASLKSPKK